ncbi:hypothetical protein J4Q44_G00218430 [Coregonus suidteri]|uniref:SUEL-type lectin domain-containing protein n=1 Tax=Coregonus suidteri TaxID=861788 RepID=A0AAN8R0Y6_9TELE
MARYLSSLLLLLISSWQVEFGVSQSSRIACEGQTAHLHCEGGAIRIIGANYGRRDHRTCGRGIWIYNGNCIHHGTYAIVSSRCNGRSYCAVPARNSVFGDPCQAIWKYLEVKWICKRAASAAAVGQMGSGMLVQREQAAGPHYQLTNVQQTPYLNKQSPPRRKVAPSSGKQLTGQ